MGGRLTNTIDARQLTDHLSQDPNGDAAEHVGSDTFAEEILEICDSRHIRGAQLLEFFTNLCMNTPEFALEIFMMSGQFSNPRQGFLSLFDLVLLDEPPWGFGKEYDANQEYPNKW